MNNKGKMLIRVFVQSSLFIALFLFTAQAQDQAGFETQLDAFVKTEMEKSGAKGLTLAIAQSDGTIYTQGYGLADETANKPVTTKTVFRIGSLSKVFTALGIMKLHETGKLNIDAPMVDVLPSFTIKPGPLTQNSTSGDITPRHMMTQHSGLPSDYFHNNYTEFPPSLEEFTDQFKNEFLAYPAGHVYSYSNSAFTILGRIIEVAAETPFGDYMDEELLLASGMSLSSFYLNDNISDELSKGYFKGDVTPYMIIPEVPAGTLYSNADDMANFMNMILNKGLFSEKRVIEEDTLEEMFRLQNSDNERDRETGRKRGLGWAINEDYAGKSFGWEGSTAIFHSNVEIIPEQDLGVFVSINTAEGAGSMRRIAAFALEKALELLRNVEKSVEQAEVKVRIPVPWSTEELRKHPGAYSFAGGGGLFQVNRVERKLEAFFRGQQFNLILMSDGAILLGVPEQLRPIPGLTLTFKTITDGDVAIIHDVNNPDSLMLRVPPTNISKIWSSRTGIYFNDNQGNLATTGIILSMQKGQLIAHIMSPGVLFGTGGYMEFILIPYDDNHAYIHGLGRNGGETVRVDEAGNIIVMGNRMIKASLLNPKSFDLQNGYFPRLN